MNPSYLIALLSALSFGAMYLNDTILCDCVYKRPSQAMFVSSLFCFLPAPIVLMFGWQMPAFTAAVLAVLSGIVLMFANWAYFSVLFSDAGEATEVAAFDNSTVLFTSVVVLALQFAGLAVPDTILPRQWFGIAVGVAGLIGLSLYGDKLEYVTWKYRFRLILFMVLGSAYEVLADISISMAGIEGTTKAYIAVSPFFWIGFSTGILTILPRKEWQGLKENVGTMLKNWFPIVISELFALAAFGLMMLGFAGGHVAVVAMLAGSSPIVVFFGGIVLRRCFGQSEEAFPPVQHPVKKIAMVMLSILGAALASWGS